MASNDTIKEEEIFLTKDEKSHVGSEHYPKDSKYNRGCCQKERYKGVIEKSRKFFHK